VQQLQCTNGTLHPATFSCIRKHVNETTPLPTHTTRSHCVVPTTIPHASNPSCIGSKAVSTGDMCKTSCNQGYRPSTDSLLCVNGSFSPSTFRCVQVKKAEQAYCAPPVGVPFAAHMPCREGGNVASGSDCVPQCGNGYEPSEKSLRCSNGTLHPKTFLCIPNASGHSTTTTISTTIQAKPRASPSPRIFCMQHC